MDSGQLDLKGLCVAAATHGLGQIKNRTGIELSTEDLAQLVPTLMKQMGLPEVVEIGLAGMALGRIAIAGYVRQQAITRSHRNVSSK